MASSDDRSALAQSLTSGYSEWIAEALDELPECFLITDPAIPGHPIVFASRGFLAMERYAMDEVFGRNGRIFQVSAMERRSVMEIREAVREEWTVQISLLNYCRDGALHWILFHMCPVFEAAGSGRVVHFLAAQVPVPPRSRARSRSRWCGGATGMMLRACRNELQMDEDLGCSRAEESFVDEGLGCSHAEESFVEMRSGGVEAEEPPVATNCEKEKAVNAANSIVSTLNRYSKITGRVVCGKRCCPVGVPLLSSSLIISLGRIKQNFVLLHCLPSMIPFWMPIR
ncbi:protein TWIN LOV 1-like isoform X1 [Ananas comosus]|uniref:Protein TWIN LOV 1-like isoform X1 n=1 Tax=Ananas comosus TaxID=4615 RepID=A0A6P5EBG1_ANACO|nr:protein TWIN LOV 1-like isoform X1 [Ananas comosus]XP_020080472.1 protein TWIN LOV 1-like isoform X1 [Ananas comosus]